MKTRGQWAIMLTWVNSYKSLIQHLDFQFAMATNQNDECVQLLYAWWRTTQQTFVKKVLSKYLQWDTFTFLVISQWKLSVAIATKPRATAIKNKSFVEANVMNISAKFQLHPPYGFWGDDFWIFFRKFILSVAMATDQIQQFGQNSYVWYGRGLLKEHLCKTFVNISAMRWQ